LSDKHLIHTDSKCIDVRRTREEALPRAAPHFRRLPADRPHTLSVASLATAARCLCALAAAAAAGTTEVAGEPKVSDANAQLSDAILVPLHIASARRIVNAMGKNIPTCQVAMNDTLFCARENVNNVN